VNGSPAGEDWSHEEIGRIDDLDLYHLWFIESKDQSGDAGEEGEEGDIRSLASNHLEVIAHRESTVRHRITYIVVGVFVFLVVARVMWIPLHLGTIDEMDRVFDPMWNTTLGLVIGLVGYFVGQRTGGLGAREVRSGTDLRGRSSGLPPSFM
jgi:hypothetical protein